MTTITVLIPTYRRTKDLERCLEAIKKQNRPADEVLIVVRDVDTETWDFLDKYDSNSLPLSPIKVIKPGVFEAHTAGYDAAKGDIIAITDDDAAPHADWLERIETYFLSDSSIGGVGGRDRVYLNSKDLIEGSCKVVGRVQWYGGIIGNHHLGVGEPREVDVLKGVNSSYRRSALKDFSFDKRLRISGKNTHFELAIGLALKQAGWKLIYDPTLLVDHYQGKRHLMTERHKFDAVGITNSVYNQTLILMEYLSPIQQTIFFLWAVLVGARGKRGFVQYLKFLPREGFLSQQQFLASLRGRWQGWRTWKEGVDRGLNVDRAEQNISTSK